MSEASIVNLRQAVQGAPTAEAHARLGKALLDAGQVREAERELRAAIALDHRCASAWVNLGGILFARWEFGAAAAANRAAAAAEPGLAIAHLNQGICHLHVDEPHQAVDCLTRAIELEPGNGGAYHHLAVALHAVGRPIEGRLCAAYARELGYRPTRESAEALARAAERIEES